MKILHCHTSLRSGGVESFITSLANEQSKNNDVTVCTIFEPRETDVFYNKLDPRVKRVSLGKAKQGFSLREMFGLVSVIRQGQYDIVNLHGCLYYYLVTVILCCRKVRFFYTVHSAADKENVSWDKYIVWAKKLLFKRGIIKAVTISRQSQKNFEMFYEAPNRLIENGIAQPDVQSVTMLNDYRITPSTKVFLHPARISLAKNQIVLCEAFKRMIAAGYDVVLLICGSAEDKTIFADLQPYWNERIVYIGEQDNVPSLLASADAMCLPSLWEGMPITLIESLAVGCIPICSPVGGIIDVIVDGENGLLSDDAGVDAYEKALIRYMQLPDYRLSEIKHNCQRTYHRFNIATTSQNYINYYNDESHG